MARSALRALDRLELPGVDSFLFINDNADDRAEQGRNNGLDDAHDHAGTYAPSSVVGLDIAGIAPEEMPAELDHPIGPPALGIGTGGSGAAGAGGGSRPTVDIGAITVLDPHFMGGKGGVPGPSGGRKGGGGDGDPGVLKNYYSGSSLGTDTNVGAYDDGFDIWIEFKGTWTQELQQAFIDAANYFTTIITDDIGGGGAYRGKIIDDLYVTAELKAIDGVGGVLGRAGPSAVWTATSLTAAGQMQFDSADAQAYFNLGLWDDIVTHELMHVLGFGTLWEYGRDLVDGFNYIGQSALDAYRSAGYTGATYIPVEDGGGSGTAGGHWDEDALGNELMTGYINNGGNYLSAFSVMALQDLGYAVKYMDYPYDGVSQPYTEPDALV